MDDQQLRDAATAWVDGDPDPETRSQLQQALDEDDLPALRAAMERPLDFGTAGLRGAVGPGPARMNRATVIRTTWALAQHLATETDPEEAVCVGFDARPDSARFAADTIGVLVAAGRRVLAFDEPSPTPLVAWAARESNAAGAVVVTASHNPPQDNGYKVYGPDAIQIVPPIDTAIANLIERAPAAAEVPRAEDVWDHDQVEVLRGFARKRYLDEIELLVKGDEPRGDVRLVHTSLHGVGGDLVVAALQRTGVEDVVVVDEQHAPDGTFPTVGFPNPEEPGALDLAFGLADEVDADLVIANDPDGDRLAVGLPDGDGWRRLSGNEVAALLADDLLRRGPDKAVVATSIVTSPWVAEVAAHHGARFEATLTGFKWIWHALHHLELEGWTPVLGAEEALGYSVGTTVRDKDGIGAAVVLVDLARRLAADGRTLADRLTELRERDGAWVAAQLSAVRDDPDGPEQIAAAMARIRSQPPAVLAGVKVTNFRDLSVGEQDRPAWLPDSNLVELTLEGGRALLRPSGTEPKIKAYVDLVSPGDPADGRARADLVGRALLAAAGLH